MRRLLLANATVIFYAPTNAFSKYGKLRPTQHDCAQERDTIWDGIKRDRWGWFGDARIIKLALGQCIL